MSQQDPNDPNTPQDIRSDLEVVRSSQSVSMDTTIAQLLDQAVSDLSEGERTEQVNAAKSYYVFISKCYIYVNDC